MPIPSSINDLSTTAGSNSPAGSESPSLIDDYLRTYASYIALLRDGAQGNAFNYAAAGGTANAITATYSPAVTTLSDSTVLLVKAASVNTGAATFSPNGLTAKPIVGLAHGALVGGEIAANGDICLQYNTSVGGGSWVLVYSSGVPIQVVGQCRLSVASATSLVLKPYNGQNVTVNGGSLPVPLAGVSVANTGLAASTLYYVYLSGTTAAPVLNLSTTGHVTTSTGLEVKSGDATQTLVGMIYTSGSTPGQFVDSAAQRFCLNWFNRRDISCSTAGAGLGITSGSEVSSTIRNYFLSWSDETVKSIIAGQLAGSTASQRGDLVILVDNTVNVGQPAAFGRTTGANFAAGTYTVSLTLPGRAVLSEGLHYVTAYSYVTGGTGNYSSIYIDTDIRG